METSTAQPVAGWYTDPADSANERWWGGLDWTDHVRPLAAPAAPAPPSPAFQPTPPAYTAPQLAAPSAHAAHAAPPLHAAPSPLLATPTPSAPAYTPPFSAEPSFSLTTPEAAAPPAPAPFAPAPQLPPAAPLAPEAASPFTTAPQAAFTPPPAPAPQASFTPPPAPAPQLPPVAQAAPPTLPPPLTNTLVLTPAPAPVAIAPVASAAGTTADLPAFATATEASIPQYASQLQPAADTALGVPVTAWDAIPSGASPSAFFAEPPATNPYPFRAQPAPQPGTAITSGPTPTWVGGGYETPAAPPSNTSAVIGFVFSLLGLSIVGLIASLKGLATARRLESEGQRPVGRILARWGVGLSTVSLVLSVIVTSLVLTVGPAFLYIIPGMSDLLGSVAASAYDRQAYEGVLIQEITEQTGVAPTSVTCPDTFTATPGNSIECRIVLDSGEQFVVRSTVESDGSVTTQTIA